MGSPPTLDPTSTRPPATDRDAVAAGGRRTSQGEGVIAMAAAGQLVGLS